MVVVDGWINHMTKQWLGGFAGNPVWAQTATFFGQDGGFGGAQSIEEQLDAMTEGGVDRALLTGTLLDFGAMTIDAAETMLSLCADHADRLRAALVIYEMPTVRAVTRAIEHLGDHPMLKAIRVVPFTVGAPANDRLFYPVYERCEALGLPVSVNVGIPGPKTRASWMDPLALDDLLLDFPDLVVVAAHMGHPWESVLIRLMMKYENLYLKTSAFLAKYFDEQVVRFADSSRGRHKMLFASDWPMLPLQRAVAEARRLPIGPESLNAFLGGNALRVLNWENP